MLKNPFPFDPDEVIVSTPLVITDNIHVEPWILPTARNMRIADFKSVNNFLIKFERHITSLLGWLVEQGAPTTYQLQHVFTPVPQAPQHSFYQNWLTFYDIENKTEQTIGLIAALRRPNQAFHDILDRDPENRWIAPIKPGKVLGSPIHSTYVDNEGMKLSVGLPEDGYELGTQYTEKDGNIYVKEVGQSWFSVYHRWRKITIEVEE